SPLPPGKAASSRPPLNYLEMLSNSLKFFEERCSSYLGALAPSCFVVLLAHRVRVARRDGFTPSGTAQRDGVCFQVRAHFQSAGRRTVRTPGGVLKARRLEAPRYSRLEICATLLRPAAKHIRAASLSDVGGS